MKYIVFISQKARMDITSIVDYIENTLSAPLTANHFYSGLKTKVGELSQTADIYPESHHPAILKYGSNARRINYKNFAIIYTIEEQTVIVHRIIHGSLIA
jgi:plasmid stabilization system protein ParE